MQVVSAGGRVAFQCLMRGNPQPKGEWLHNGQSVFRNQYISISGEGQVISGGGRLRGTGWRGAGGGGGSSSADKYSFGPNVGPPDDGARGDSDSTKRRG